VIFVLLLVVSPFLTVEQGVFSSRVFLIPILLLTLIHLFTSVAEMELDLRRLRNAMLWFLALFLSASLVVFKTEYDVAHKHVIYQFYWLFNGIFAFYIGYFFGFPRFHSKQGGWYLVGLYVVLLIGFGDLFFRLFNTQEQIFGRFIGDVAYVGLRFNSIFGEPRDAVIYFFIFAVLVLHSAHGRRLKTSESLGLCLTCLALVCTRSVTAVCALLVGLGYCFVFYHQTRAWISLILMTIPLVFLFDGRHIEYLLFFQETSLNNPGYIEKLATTASGNFVDILPLSGWFEGSWTGLIFGSGMASTAVTNGTQLGIDFAPTRSLIIRLLVDGGLATTFVYFAWLHFNILKKVRTSFDLRVAVVTVLVIAAALAHLSYASLVFYFWQGSVLKDYEGSVIRSINR